MEKNSNATQQPNPKQKKIIWICTFLAAFVLTFVIVWFSLYGCSSNSKKLEVSNVRMSSEYNEYLGYTVKISGVAKNVGNRNYSYASVEFSVYDSQGNNLGTALDNINNLNKGDTWRFEATLLSFPKTQPASYKLVEMTAW